MTEVPFTFKSVLISLFEVFDFNKGFFFTFYSMIIKPGKAIDDYLKGATARYHSPLRYLLTVLAFTALIGYLMLGFHDNKMTQMDVLRNWFFLGLVGYTILFNFLFFRTNKTFVEHLIIGLFQCSTTFGIIWLHIALFPAKGTGRDVVLIIMLTTVIVYLIWFLVSVFRGRKFIIILKAILFAVIAFLGITYFFALSRGLEL